MYNIWGDDLLYHIYVIKSKRTCHISFDLKTIMGLKNRRLASFGNFPMLSYIIWFLWSMEDNIIPMMQTKRLNSSDNKWLMKLLWILSACRWSSTFERFWKNNSPEHLHIKYPLHKLVFYYLFELYQAIDDCWIHQLTSCVHCSTLLVEVIPIKNKLHPLM